MTTQQATKSENGKSKRETVENDKFFEVSTSPLQYKPEMCGSKPVQGKVISFEKMPFATDDKGEKKAWYVFNIQLTAPTLGVDIDDEVRTVEAGEMIRLPMSEKLKGLLPMFQAATRANQLLEVRIQPTKKVSLGGGRTMWNFRVGVDAAQLREKREEGLPALIDSSDSGFGDLFPTRQSLPKDAEGDIPF